MTVAINKRSGAGTFAFLKSKMEWMEISDYYVGDIDSDKPVSVLSGATVVGNIFAPQVRVAGLLYGTAVSHDITVTSNGLVWSNVYTIRLQMEAGGTIQGFISSIDAETYDMLCETGNPNDLPSISFGKDAPEGVPAPPTSSELDALIRLQAQAGAALAARAELERSFETRLTESVGATSARATALDKEVGSIRENVQAVSQQLGEARAVSQTQEQQIERLESDLNLTRELLQGKTGEWEEVTAVYSQQSLDYEQLQAKKAEVDIAFHTQTQEADDFADRVTNLETALQSSLQHSGEQEDSLIRWQELGETRQTRISELESELSTIQFRLEENGNLVDMLRTQRQHAEESWSKSNGELQKTAAILAALAIEHKLAKKEVGETTLKLKASIDELKPLRKQALALEEDRKTAANNLKDSSQLIQTLHQKQGVLKSELDETRIALEDANIGLEDANEALEKFNNRQTEQLSAQTTLIMVEADKTIGGLKKRLADAQLQHTVQNEQLSWHRLSLRTAQIELNQARTEIVEQEETAVSDSANDDVIREQQQKIEQYERALVEAKQEFASLQAEFILKEEELKSLRETKEALRRTRLQLKESEHEIEHHLSEMDRQGHHLADIQSTLIEREIQLQQMTDTARKQAAFIKKMKQVTTERIQKLQRQLAAK